MLPRTYAPITVLAALAAWSTQAAACPPRRSSSSASSSSGSSSQGSSSSSGSTAGSVIGSVLGALFTPRSTASSATAPSAPSGPALYVPVEVSLGFAWRSLDLGGLSYSGWDEHPGVANYARGASADGAVFGLGTGSFVGPVLSVRRDLLGPLWIGVRGGVFAQADTNGYAGGALATVRARRALLADGGAELGVRVPLGPLRLQLSGWGGARWSRFELDGLGVAGCTTVPEIVSWSAVVRAQAQLDVPLGRTVSVSAFATYGVLGGGEQQLGMSLSWHPPRTSTTP